MTEPLRIDVFSDIVCPWCFIGVVRLERALAALGMADSDVKLSYHAFMLDPDTPEGGRDLQDELRKKYGVEPRQMFDRVEAVAEESGIPLDLSKVVHSYPTARAHTLLRHAEAKGTQPKLSRALFDAYFLEVRNISDVNVLAAIASAHGFDDEEARALVTNEAELEVSRREATEAARAGIRGVPFFIVNGNLAVSGGQPESVFQDVIQRALAERAA